MRASASPSPPLLPLPQYMALPLQPGKAAGGSSFHQVDGGDWFIFYGKLIPGAYLFG